MVLTLIPRLSEKSYAQAQKDTYVFMVPLTANKQQITAAVLAQYEGIIVKDVRSVVVKGKAVRASRGKRQNPGTAHRKNIKKAYVTLSSGSIEMFKDAEA